MDMNEYLDQINLVAEFASSGVSTVKILNLVWCKSTCRKYKICGLPGSLVLFDLEMNWLFVVLILESYANDFLQNKTEQSMRFQLF